MGEVDAEGDLPVVEVIGIDEDLSDFPGFAVGAGHGVGVAAVAGFVVEADAFVIGVVVVENEVELIEGPAGGCGAESGEGDVGLVHREGAEETEDLGADEGGELAFVAGDVGWLGWGVCFGIRFPVGVAQAFPFVEQAGVGAAQEAGEPSFEFLEGFGFGGVGDGLGEDFVDAAEVAEEDALGAMEVVVVDVVGKAAEVLEHFAGDGFGADVFLADPGVGGGEVVEGVVDEVAIGFGVFEFFQFGDALLVRDALCLHGVHGLGFDFVELAAEDDVGVFEDGLAEGEDVCGVGGAGGIDEGEGVEQVEGEGLVEREVVLQGDVELEFG